MLSIANTALKTKIKSYIKFTSLSSEVCFERFDAILNGRSTPETLVFPFEAGTGKSRGIQKYLAGYKARRFLPDEGVLIVLSRRDEIHSYIQGAGLTGNEYGVLDSQSPKERASTYGGNIRHNDAPILFTTSQLIAARCGKDFNEFKDLFYRGNPRALRLWDEEFRFADVVSITNDDLAVMRAAVRYFDPRLATALEALEARLSMAGDGDQIMIPVLPTMHRVGSVHPLDDKQRASITGISGKCARISKAQGLTYITAEARRLPANIAPLMVFDASARVSSAYTLMGNAGLPVLVMPGTNLSYRNARFFHMRKGAGRGSLRGKPGRLENVIFEASEKINEDEEPWIVVYNDVPGLHIVDKLSSACTLPERIKFVKWGDHRASNDYRLIENIMCIGLLRYSDAGYEKVHLSALGKYKNRDAEIAGIRESEAMSHMLQAFGRCNMRNYADGACGDCDIYIVDSHSNMNKLLEATFPDCILAKWEPKVVALSKKQREVLAYISRIKAAIGVDGIKKSSVYRTLKIDKSYFGKIVNCNKFKSELGKIGLTVDYFSIKPISNP
ncbi:MAG: hypothetical protein V4537_03260 [Pseudomonadota bacterium]